MAMDQARWQYDDMNDTCFLLDLFYHLSIRGPSKMETTRQRLHVYGVYFTLRSENAYSAKACWKFLPYSSQQSAC